jgi:hypothetical protein
MTFVLARSDADCGRVPIGFTANGFPQKYSEVSALVKKATCAYSWLTSASRSILLQKSFCTVSAKSRPSLDYFVSANEHRRRHGETERLRGLAV